MAKITINGTTVKVKNGSTILSAAKSIGIDIPTLCFIEEINEIGFCRICVVEVEGEQDLVSACNTEIKSGMVIHTDSEKVIQSREATLQLLASRHRFDCWRCPKDGMCEFYDLLKQHDVVFDEFGPGIGRSKDIIAGSGISQDQSKCVLCKRCVAVCQNVVTANVLKFHDDDGMNPFVSPTVGLSFDQTGCVFCGQCVKACPTGTLFETDSTTEVLQFIRDDNNQVVVQLDKQASIAIAEEFGYPLETPFEETIGKTYEALEKLGFDVITNTDLGEDIQAIATAREFIKRRETGGTFPVFTTTCAASNRFVELYQFGIQPLKNAVTKATTKLNELETSLAEALANDEDSTTLDQQMSVAKEQLTLAKEALQEAINKRIQYLSPVKSPHILQGALLKHKMLATKAGNIKVVTVGTCSSKKYEITRNELTTNGVADVDAVLTAREVVKLVKQKGINYKALQGIKPHENITVSRPLVKGGPLMGTLQAIFELSHEKLIGDVSFKKVYGDKESDGIIEEAVVPFQGKKLWIARVQGGAAIKAFMTIMEKKAYDLVELQMCPGGCLNGGGMPIIKNLPTHEVIARREQALCTPDMPLWNPMHDPMLETIDVDDIEPLIHTTYTKKEFRRE
ncbi:[Fe-Fe] hydrogenase large subunit C-terminal domain-containing protein [Candidatus Xianfuyuplasma coldseepsis]|uniref:4Fe-4S dicluster domain-containing protein n=1 Tax=Candidatus Xianfuyuplasma coldseepsis TaxID=2782163 RepID=A0A7L7KRP1_9MOLU|nr:[Fe-Fe] hydrogenase large subunit C-terminal domain-containing protein [Xianfuyuplasma coldseepsis]QMS84468.1 4Fe-4S dicluster domain-containing protein [Xianfuyuplasma coldseepsis]